jgi:hypothetical protein
VAQRLVFRRKCILAKGFVFPSVERAAESRTFRNREETASADVSEVEASGKDSALGRSRLLIGWSIAFRKRDEETPVLPTASPVARAARSSSAIRRNAATESVSHRFFHLMQLQVAERTLTAAERRGHHHFEGTRARRRWSEPDSER